ncbi:MAG: hypothetical protein AAFY64_09850 [Pseudomonadota bacterium]
MTARNGLRPLLSIGQRLREANLGLVLFWTNQKRPECKEPRPLLRSGRALY